MYKRILGGKVKSPNTNLTNIGGRRVNLRCSISITDVAFHPSFRKSTNEKNLVKNTRPETLPLPDKPKSPSKLDKVKSKESPLKAGKIKEGDPTKAKNKEKNKLKSKDKEKNKDATNPPEKQPRSPKELDFPPKAKSKPNLTSTPGTHVKEKRKKTASVKIKHSPAIKSLSFGSELERHKPKQKSENEQLQQHKSKQKAAAIPPQPTTGEITGEVSPVVLVPHTILDVGEEFQLIGTEQHDKI